MATDDSSTAGPSPEPVPCQACRGTGQVVSNLGGERQLVECPWCDGGGVRLGDHDAQARKRGDRSPAPDPAPEPGGDQAA